MAKTPSASKAKGPFPVKCFLLSREEFRAAEDARMALARSKPKGEGASVREILKPGAMWFAHWFFDPQDPEHASRRDKALASFKAGEKSRWYLSQMYWEQWSAKRSPICVLTPSGVEWCVDSVASNGPGWTVTGDAPLITCAPSIDVPGYHGFLRNGEFSPPV